MNSIFKTLQKAKTKQCLVKKPEQKVIIFKIMKKNWKREGNPY